MFFNFCFELFFNIFFVFHPKTKKFRFCFVFFCFSKKAKTKKIIQNKKCVIPKHFFFPNNPIILVKNNTNIPTIKNVIPFFLSSLFSPPFQTFSKIEK